MAETSQTYELETQSDQRSSQKPLLVDIEKGLFAFNLVKRYGSRPLLRGVNLSLQRGEIVGLLGPNGAGKTTCFYLIVGLLAPNDGTVILDGQDVTTLPLYRRARMGIGYLPQEASIFRGLSVEKNIACVLDLIEPSRSKRRAMLDALLEEFGLAHLRKNLAVTLSGGERRRLEIARALASNPQFIFLDEPFAGIDPIALDDIRTLVSHLKDRGIGVLITDHNVQETLDVIDRAYIIHDGLVLTEGTAREIVENEEVRRCYLGERFRFNG
jgi:lipopolysaccharide export system ATP-binding protein